MENSNDNILKDPLNGTSLNVNKGSTDYNSYNLPGYNLIQKVEYSETGSNQNKFAQDFSIAGFDNQSNL